ncbi:MAG: HD domain-containing protein [Patescibacteria group bacterium]
MATLINQIVSGSEFLHRAYDLAKRIHGTEIRKNGEPYFNHCIATVETLARWGLDEATLAAGFLHDTPKSAGEKIIPEIERDFGKETAELVARTAAIGRIPYHGTESKTENLRRFILYTSQDIRVILIKFAGRLNTMQSLYIYPEDVQKTIALKTMEIYAPVASQLGMYGVARELEDLAFPYLYPKDYASLMETVRERVEAREAYLTRLKPILAAELRENGVPSIRIESRAKHHFSLYKKLLKHDMDIDRIYDLVGIRVVVPEVADCYSALGIIHKNWSPLPGRIKDYIASPKPNGYQSLHTTVYTPEDKITEIQIRTEAMHQVAELGVAAYYAYRAEKGKQQIGANTTETDLAFTRELRNFPRRVEDIEFFQKTLLALTPRGDVIDLPKGSTPIDFAYRIHSDLGNQCSGAKVNGKIVPLHTELASGDVVEILRQKQKNPSSAWLSFAKTNQARESIRAALKGKNSEKIETLEKPWTVKIAAEDRPGLIPEVERIAGTMKIKIKKLNLPPKQKNQALRSISLECVGTTPKRIYAFAEALRNVAVIRKVTASAKTKKNSN